MEGKFIRAVLLQFSGIVGAGIFALPYFLYNSNFYFAVLGMFFITVITAIINIFYIQIICNTQGDHQLSGYAKKYLGEKFKYVAAISLIISGLGAVLAYIKLGAKFLGILFSVNNYVSVLIFLLMIVAGYSIKSKSIKKFLDYLPFVVVFMALLLFQIAFRSQLLGAEIKSFNLSFFGVCVFALSGFTIIPEIEELLRGESKIKNKLILSSGLGLFLAFLVYFIFSYSVVRLTGGNLTEDSVSGLVQASYLVGGLVSIFGLLITFKGAVNFMGVFHEIFYRDFKETALFSTVMAIVLPVASLLLFNLSFGSLLGWVGAGSIFVSVMLICMMILKIRKNAITLCLVSLVLAVFVFGFSSMV